MHPGPPPLFAFRLSPFTFQSPLPPFPVRPWIDLPPTHQSDQRHRRAVGLIAFFADLLHFPSRLRAYRLGSRIGPSAKTPSRQRFAKDAPAFPALPPSPSAFHLSRSASPFRLPPFDFRLSVPPFTFAGPPFTPGNVIFTPGNAVFMTGNAVFTVGNVIFTAGNAVFTAGGPLFTAGNARFTAGNVIFTAGNVVFTPGNALFTAGNVSRILDPGLPNSAALLSGEPQEVSRWPSIVTLGGKPANLKEGAQLPLVIEV